MAESARYRWMSAVATVSRKIPTPVPGLTEEREKLILFLLSRTIAGFNDIGPIGLTLWRTALAGAYHRRGKSSKEASHTSIWRWVNLTATRCQAVLLLKHRSV